MPKQIEIDGKQVTVYTEEEHEALLETAKKEAGAKALEGMLTKEDAEKLADTKAAAARKEAQAEVKRLQDDLAKVQGDAAKTADLEKKLAEAVGKQTAAERRLMGMKTLAAHTTAPLAAAEQLVGLPMFAELDFADEAAVGKALESFTSLFPVYKRAPEGEGDKGGEKGGTDGGAGAGGSDQKGGGLFNPLGGTGGGGSGSGQPDLGSMSMNDYIAARQKQDNPNAAGSGGK